MERSHIALHMKKPKPKKLSTWFERNGLHGLQLHRFTESHFEKHVKLIGSLLLAWNDLHEHLASVFAAVMGKPHWARSFAIWHATRNDGGKRRLLRTALANLQGELELDVAARAHAIREISWILDAVDKLEGFRDDSAHTPLTYRFVGNSILDFGDILTVRNLLELQQQIVVPQAGLAIRWRFAFQKASAICLSNIDTQEIEFSFSATMWSRLSVSGGTRLFHGHVDRLCQRGGPTGRRKQRLNTERKNSALARIDHSGRDLFASWTLLRFKHGSRLEILHLLRRFPDNEGTYLG